MIFNIYIVNKVYNNFKVNTTNIPCIIITNSFIQYVFSIYLKTNIKYIIMYIVNLIVIYYVILSREYI